MKHIIGFIRSYFKEVNKPVLLICSFFVAGLIVLNYGWKLEYCLTHELNIPLAGITGRFLVFLPAFIIPYILLFTLARKKFPSNAGFLICLVAAPIIFAIKAGMDTQLNLSTDEAWNSYWNDILYWPLRVVTMIIILWVFKTTFHKEESFYGLSVKKINFRPYLLMLLFMLPLIVAASTQTDFQAAYPKMKHILPLPYNAHPSWFYRLLFELSYGSDFFSIELFFRGFLVIGFIKWVGKEAILPMACFYCTIHFGKPLGECISSYFGGLLLGIVAYHTRSIYGGLMVHLGIAWMMELGGYIGNLFKW